MHLFIAVNTGHVASKRKKNALHNQVHNQLLSSNIFNGGAFKLFSGVVEVFYAAFAK